MAALLGVQAIRHATAYAIVAVLPTEWFLPLD